MRIAHEFKDEALNHQCGWRAINVMSGNNFFITEARKGIGFKDQAQQQKEMIGWKLRLLDHQKWKQFKITGGMVQ